MKKTSNKLCHFCGLDMSLRDSKTMMGEYSFNFYSVDGFDYRIIKSHEWCFKKECGYRLYSANYFWRSEEYCFCCNKRIEIIGKNNVSVKDYNTIENFKYYGITKLVRNTSYDANVYDKFIAQGNISFCLDCWENMAGKDFF